jgi:hypothetical protein
MISQNRADEKAAGAGRPAVADGPGGGAANEDLLQVANQILELTRAIHAMTAARAPAGPTQPDGG